MLRSATTEVLVARQPIYDRRLSVVAYELLFAQAGGSGGVVDPDRSAFNVVLNAFTAIGLDQLVGAVPAHIKVSRRFLLEQHALALPAERVVLELPQVDAADDALAHVAGRLAGDGYRIVLVTATPTRLRPDLVEAAEAIKVPVSPAGGAPLAERMEGLVAGRRKVIAEGVDRHEDFERCAALGFAQFQGVFLSVPNTVRGRSVSSPALTALARVAGLYAPDASFDDVERVIAHDVGLSYRFLRYVNSAFFALPRRVGSIREAMTLLGHRAVKRWATLLVMADIPGKPHELIITALLRARMCEQLAQSLGEDDLERFFTTGLLSVMDALLDIPMDEAAHALPLSDEIRDALLHHRGPPGRILAAVLAYEAGDFDQALDATQSGSALARSYVEAAAWARDAGGGLSA